MVASLSTADLGGAGAFKWSWIPCQVLFVAVTASVNNWLREVSRPHLSFKTLIYVEHQRRHRESFLITFFFFLSFHII